MQLNTHKENLAGDAGSFNPLPQAKETVGNSKLRRALICIQFYLWLLVSFSFFVWGKKKKEIKLLPLRRIQYTSGKKHTHTRQVSFYFYVSWYTENIAGQVNKSLSNVRYISDILIIGMVGIFHEMLSELEQSKTDNLNNNHRQLV